MLTAKVVLNPQKAVKLYRFKSIVLNIADNIRNGPQDYDNGYVSIGVPAIPPEESVYPGIQSMSSSFDPIA
jgi:hypothetical protein